jgi:hypothetical protein
LQAQFFSRHFYREELLPAVAAKAYRRKAKRSLLKHFHFLKVLPCVKFLRRLEKMQAHHLHFPKAHV